MSASTRPPVHSEALPTRWLASVNQPRLEYVPAAATDIRALFARVRRELQRQPVRLAGGVR